MEAERGGEPFLDMLVIGPEEAEALLEGAKPEPASQIVMPELPPPLADDRAEPPAPPIADVAVLEPVSPPLPVTEPAPTEFEPTTAAPVRVETVHEAEPAPPQPSPPPPVHPIARPVLPETIARKAPAKRALPPPRTRPEARGRQGDGQEVANRLAQSRGGTGGKADVAGHAALTTFRARIVAHLNRYKTYPEQAQERGLVGRNAVTLTLSREGRVLSAALSGPSGHALLDSATLAAVKRAQPFPAIPEGGPPSLTVTIGLNYQLQ
jgi:protein TonB